LLARMQKEDTKLIFNNQRLIQTYSLILSPLLIGGLLVAEPLVIKLLTEKWIQTVPLFQLLCVAGLVFPLIKVNTEILKVKGRADILIKFQLWSKGVAVGILVLSIPWGITGILVGHII